ncbi:MAG: WG repeat-containing protein [Ruminococcus sp.]|nr:WG repeat-containing protein [Ruminococcus sp.]
MSEKKPGARLIKDLLVTAAVTAAFAAVVLLIINGIEKGQNDKARVPLKAETSLPEEIAAGEHHSWERQLVSGWRITQLYDGLAAVEDPSRWKGGMVLSYDKGVADMAGNMVVKAEYTEVSFTPEGLIKAYGHNNTYYDSTGKAVSAPDSSEKTEDNESFIPEGDFDELLISCPEEGTALVRKGDRAVWVNDGGTELAEITGELYGLNYKSRLPEGLSYVNGGRYFMADGSCWEGIPIFRDGCCPVPHESLCGLIDSEGRVLTDFSYDGMLYLENGIWLLIKGKEFFIYDVSQEDGPVRTELPQGRKDFSGPWFYVESKEDGKSVWTVYKLTNK